ncbi:MAG TPA: molybdopterin-dependent oxidoreductase [Bacteroidia bacterium]|nr:molybdopterin-dependent oxidoreductase [Bacteroidia bacterium]
MAKFKKDPNLIVHTTTPVNAEPPIDKLRENFITPQELFYIRNHGEVPDIDINTFRLKVNGLVENELELSLEKLKNDFPKHSVMATLQCAGNRRDQLIAVAPVPGEVPWQSGAIGNAKWSGVPLKDVLAAAGVKPGALYVEFMGAEDVFRHGENVGFGASIPIDKALTNDVLLAYEMNDLPLEPTHGFPLRAVVPGYIGARSVKWLTRITLQEKPSDNYFQAHAYQLFPPQASAETVDWKSGLQLSELSVNCVITAPKEGEILPGKNILVQGFAMSGGGKKIARVDVSSNGGETWTTAVITEGNGHWAWVFWEANIELKNGEHEIIARAYDTASNTQPENARHIWNFKGYMNNAWHRVKISVKN